MLVIEDGNIKIGAFKFPDRKKPVLGIARGNECVIYGHFISDETANRFMRELAKIIKADDETDLKIIK